MFFNQKPSYFLFFHSFFEFPMMRLREKEHAATTGNKDGEQTTGKGNKDRQKESSKSTLRVEKI